MRARKLIWQIMKRWSLAYEEISIILMRTLNVLQINYLNAGSAVTFRENLITTDEINTG